MQNRSRLYTITLEWILPDNTPFRRQITESGLTKQSAKDKVIKHYNSMKVPESCRYPTFIAIRDLEHSEIES
jgi:hypothetical protein